MEGFWFTGESGVWKRTYVSVVFLLISHWCRHQCHACSGLPAEKCRWWRASDPSGGRWWWVQSSHVSARAKPSYLSTWTTASKQAQVYQTCLGCPWFYGTYSVMDIIVPIFGDILQTKKKRNSTGIRLKNVFWNYIFNCFAVESDLNKRFCSLLSTGCTKRGNNLVVEGHMKIDGIVNFNT